MEKVYNVVLALFKGTFNLNKDKEKVVRCTSDANLNKNVLMAWYDKSIVIFMRGRNSMNDIDTPMDMNGCHDFSTLIILISIFLVRTYQLCHVKEIHDLNVTYTYKHHKNPFPSQSTSCLHCNHHKNIYVMRTLIVRGQVSLYKFIKSCS